jgi:hypothetical protein
MPLFNRRCSLLEVQNRALIKTARERAARMDELERELAVPGLVRVDRAQLDPDDRRAPETDCVAGHEGLELRNVAANYLFERSYGFPGIQPNSGRRDY